MMDPNTTGGESKVDTKHTPPPLASGSREEGRNLTANATTTTNHEEKATGVTD
jgi:hypothetical protein